MAEDWDDFQEKLRFLLHKVALECCHSDDFKVLVDALWKIGVIQGTLAFTDAERAWRRAREKIRKRLDP